MKRFLIAFACFVFFACALVQRGLAQSADEPATRDDVILYLRTMHSHDMFRRTMEVQSQAIQQLLHDQMVKDTGSVPAEFDARMKKCMEDLDKNMPIDQITEAMIPAYQSHFTKGDHGHAYRILFRAHWAKRYSSSCPRLCRRECRQRCPS